MTKNNIFSGLPASLNKEVFENLVTAENIRIERIISRGHSSPETGWYDQDENEWVMLVSGSATLLFEGEKDVELKKGDFLLIPARQRHKVLRTSADQPTIWLAVFFS